MSNPRGSCLAGDDKTVCGKFQDRLDLGWCDNCAHEQACHAPVGSNLQDAPCGRPSQHWVAVERGKMCGACNPKGEASKSSGNTGSGGSPPGGVL